jgi:hypothetical protein
MLRSEFPLLFFHYIMQAEKRSLSAGDPQASLRLNYFLILFLDLLRAGLPKIPSNQRILGILSRVPISLHGCLKSIYKREDFRQAGKSKTCSNYL